MKQVHLRVFSYFQIGKQVSHKFWQFKYYKNQKLSIILWTNFKTSLPIMKGNGPIKFPHYDSGGT
jgi:hypothetical protein